MAYDVRVNPAAPAESLEAKRPPIDNGLGVPDPARYHDPATMKRERECLWPAVWLLAGVTSDIPEAGDYFTFEIGHESTLIVRQKDGSIRAFFNVCPHRGNRIAQNDFGSVGHFTCAFHGWQFECSGRLRCITDEETFAPSLVAHRPGLTEIRCDVAGGLVFVNMDGKAPPLREWIGLPDGYIENYEIDRMHVVRHVRSVWNANWKVGVDAFYETYHLPHIHPQTQGVMEDFSQYDLYPNGFSRMIVPLCVKSHRLGDQQTVDAGLRFMMKDAGMNPDEFDGTAREVRAAVQRSKRARARRLGLTHYARLTDGQLTDSWATGLFPNVQIGMHPEGVFIMRFLPDADDPLKFHYDNITMFRYVDDPDYTVPAWMGLPEGTDVTGAVRPPVERFPEGQLPDLGEVLSQDIELVAAVGAGCRSRGFRGPLWSEQEARVRHFHRELDRYLNGEKARRPAVRPAQGVQ
jgi:phenylpropionate dioxygenase-like ring-hydroxylating dioxygenase large terminal subunit